jgi:hypothetical protein
MQDHGSQDQARRWRQKAEELRTVADQIANPFARDSLRRMADTYETLAAQAEKRSAGDRETGLG